MGMCISCAKQMAQCWIRPQSALKNRGTNSVLHFANAFINLLASKCWWIRNQLTAQVSFCLRLRCARWLHFRGVNMCISHTAFSHIIAIGFRFVFFLIVICMNQHANWTNFPAQPTFGMEKRNAARDERDTRRAGNSENVKRFYVK